MRHFDEILKLIGILASTKTPTRYFRMLVIIASILVILPTHAFAFVPQQSIFSISLADKNCDITVGFNAIPNGPTSYLSYVYGDDVLIEGRIVNSCPEIRKMGFYLLNSSNHVVFNKTFFNISQNNYVEFNGLIKNDKINMSLIPAVLDLNVEDSNYHGKMFDNATLKWNTTELKTTIKQWKRSIDFSGYVPEIKDEIYFDTNRSIDKFIIGYSNLVGGDLHNFIFLDSCEINNIDCQSKLLLMDKWTGIEVYIKNVTAKDNKLTLIYYLEKYSENYNGQYFPFDKIYTKIEVPPIRQITYEDGFTEDINYVPEMPLLIKLPSGFAFDEMESKAYTGYGFCDNVQYLLPAPPKTNSYDSASIPQSCITPPCQDMFINIFIQPLIRPPQVQIISGEGERIIYLEKIDSNCIVSKGLVFVHGDIYLFLYFLIILIGIFFIIRTFITHGFFENLFEYITVSVFAILGQFLSFPRPFQITLVEITVLVISAIIIIESLILKYLENKKRRQILKEWILDTISLNIYVLRVSLFITFLSIVIFVLNSFNPIVNQLLSSSIYAPWGIVTAIFVHGNFNHIYSNLLFLWVLTVYMVFQSEFLKHDILSREEIKKRIKFSMATALVVAVLLNAIYSFILVPWPPTLGASGVVFAFVGISMSFSFMNVSYILKKFRIRGVSKRVIIYNLYSILANVLVFIAIFMGVTSYTRLFFGIGDPQINSLIHLISFVATFFVVLIYEYSVFHLPTVVSNIKLFKAKKK